MVKNLLILLFTSVLAFPLSTLVFAQDAPLKAAKEGRWEGTVIRSNPDKSTLTVRDSNSVEMIVQYDSSTQWVSQEHGSKKVNNIDASQVKDNDRVICRGTREKEGVFHATRISKRLSPKTKVVLSDVLKQPESGRQRVGFVLDGLSQAGSSYVVITANFTE